MTISVQIIADSISPAGVRLTTMQLRYPRFIHAELMTHRVFSRNASSSRAIPVKRMIEDIRNDPAAPVFWGSNKPGMQAGAELEGTTLALVQSLWFQELEDRLKLVETMADAGLHKQIANRLLEPWAHINVVISATDWENFYTLRRHADAQPEIKALADAMWDTQQASIPDNLESGEWHLPYTTPEEAEVAHTNALCIGLADGNELLKRISVARCARVSYLTHDGRQTTIEEDLKLFDRLMGAQPLHASPAEHQATPCENHNNGTSDYTRPVFRNEHLTGNFTGWIQYRKTLDGEFIPG